jgi:predicted Zn-dependent peptidase
LPGRVIAFAGDVTRAEAETLAKGLLPADLSAAPPELAPHYAPLTPAERRPRAQDLALPRLTQIYFGCVRESLRLKDDDYPALAIADHVLGGHFYSRLKVSLRHESGDTYGAGTSDGADVEPGRYELSTFTRLEKEQDTETRLREVLAKLHADGITDDERQAAIGFYRGRRAFAKRSPDDSLWWWMSEWDQSLPEGFYDALPERMAGVTLTRINEVIRQFYDPTLFTMVKVRPAK